MPTAPRRLRDTSEQPWTHATLPSETARPRPRDLAVGNLLGVVSGRREKDALPVDRLLAILALIVGAAGLGVAVAGRRELAIARRKSASATSSADQALADTRRELDGLRGELDELRSRSESPPPLPKARRGALDDLREQLKASHEAAAAKEADTSTE